MKRPLRRIITALPFAALLMLSSASAQVTPWGTDLGQASGIDPALVGQWELAGGRLVFPGNRHIDFVDSGRVLDINEDGEFHVDFAPSVVGPSLTYNVGSGLKTFTWPNARPAILEEFHRNGVLPPAMGVPSGCQETAEFAGWIVGDMASLAVSSGDDPADTWLDVVPNIPGSARPTMTCPGLGGGIGVTVNVPAILGQVPPTQTASGPVARYHYALTPDASWLLIWTEAQNDRPGVFYLYVAL